MEILWERYLSTIFPVQDIDHIVIYTDQYRYWLSEGLMDFAQKQDWKVSLQLIEEITDEEGMEIRQGIGFLSSNTLLVAIFSERNPIIDELNSIFPLLHSPHAYQGYSLILHQSLPDQYFPLHLQTDILESSELERSYQDRLRRNITIKGEESTYLEGTVSDQVTFPFGRGNNHTILPATETIASIEPSSLEGTIKVRYSIGAYIEHNELVDPFGLIDKPIDLLIENGEIVDIRGNKLVIRRLNEIIDLPYTADTIQISIGLGPAGPISGFIEHDRLLKDVMTISWIDQQTGSYLEFVVGPVEIE